MSAKARAVSDREYKRMLEEMPLTKLRHARELTQENLASVMRMKQGDVSKLERRTDMYVSTLASYLNAMGGALEIRAIFPDGFAVRISQFGNIAGTRKS